MRTTAKWQLTVGLIVVAGIAGPVQSAAAGSAAASLSFTIHVRNYAHVDAKELAKVEKVASRIFQKAGVVSQWVDAPLTSKDLQKSSVDKHSFGLSQIWVSLLPSTMSDRINMPASVTGLAPGEGPDRVLGYVFYSRVEDLHRRQVLAMGARANMSPASVADILGNVIAHEVGHILLNLAVHSETGIMRGDWDFNVLNDIACSSLGFTKQQGEVMQAEVARRARQQDVLEAAD
jgi:hypothetical protein